MENLYFPEFLTWIPTQAGGRPWQCGSLHVIAEGEEFLLENLCFQEFFGWIFHLGRWMPVAMRKSPRHSKGEEFLLVNLYFPGVLDLDFPPRQVDARGNAEVFSS